MREGERARGRGGNGGRGRWGRREGEGLGRQAVPERLRPSPLGTPWRQPLELQAQLGTLGSANLVAPSVHLASTRTGPRAARGRRAGSGDCRQHPRVFGTQSQCSCLGTGGFGGLCGPPTTSPWRSWRNVAGRSQQLQGSSRPVWAPNVSISCPQPAGGPGRPARHPLEFSVARRRAGRAGTEMRAARPTGQGFGGGTRATS